MSEKTQEAGVYGRLFRKFLALDWMLKKYQMQASADQEGDPDKGSGLYPRHPPAVLK